MGGPDSVLELVGVGLVPPGTPTQIQPLEESSMKNRSLDTGRPLPSGGEGDGWASLLFIEIHIYRGQGASLVGKVLATKTQGLEFDSYHSCTKAENGSMCLESQC